MSFNSNWVGGCKILRSTAAHMQVALLAQATRSLIPQCPLRLHDCVSPSRNRNATIAKSRRLITPRRHVLHTRLTHLDTPRLHTTSVLWNTDMVNFLCHDQYLSAIFGGKSGFRRGLFERTITTLLTMQ
jgi:hypothetical protein